MDDHGRIQCSLVIAKSRLAPVKTVNIPRLELTAAVLSVRLDILLRKELQVTACTSTFWSDSTAVLHIILNSRPFVPVTFDPDDEPLTPNHLLLSRGSANLPPGLFDKRDSYARRRWAQTQYFGDAG